MKRIGSKMKMNKIKIRIPVSQRPYSHRSSKVIVPKNVYKRKEGKRVENE